MQAKFALEIGDMIIDRVGIRLAVTLCLIIYSEAGWGDGVAWVDVMHHGKVTSQIAIVRPWLG